MIPLFGMAPLAAIAVQRMSAFGRPFKALAVLLVLGLLWEEAQGTNRPSYRKNFVFRDFGVSALRCAPPSSLLIIDRVLFDEPTSCLLVTTQVDKKRRDVRFLYRPGTLFEM